MFRHIHILPSYHSKTAVIQWDVDPELKNSEFYIYKKQDGGQKWELLNTEPVYGNMYLDTNFYSTNKLDVPHYKLLAIDGDNEYESEQVAIYSHLRRREFGIIKKIIMTKFLQAKHDGIPVLYYPAIKNGKVSTNIDPVTGQRMGTSCPDEDQDTNDYGTYYQGGYCPPFITFVRLLGAKLQRSSLTETGNWDETTQNIEILSYPPVRAGDMIVDVATDKRYIINENIKPQEFKNIPVSYTTSMSLQSRNSECYQVPIPTNYDSMLKQLKPRFY